MTRPTPMTEPRFVSVREVAALLRVSKMTVYRLIHSQDLPAWQVGKQMRIPLNAVWKYLGDHRYDPKAFPPKSA